MENVDYSFKILEEILMLKEYKTREEVIKVGETMLKIANKSNILEALKDSYAEANSKLNRLSFDEMNEIIEILSADDDEDEDDIDE